MEKNIYCVFDTETIGIGKKWIYDIGLVIVEKKGKVLHSAQWLVEEVFNNDNLMNMAYYGEKKETFYSKVNIPIFPFYEVRKQFNQILEEMKVTHITAYNLGFDARALQDTVKYTNLPGHKFLGKNLQYFDLWEACCRSIFQQKYFQETALNNHWLTEKGNFRTSAEIAYRYITGNYNFIESHTALEDAYIEGEILQKVLKQKKKITRNSIPAHPWRLCQRKK